MSQLSLYVNDEQVYEYRQDIDLDDKQLAFIEKMDSDMDRGIKIKGELIPQPDQQQRATFVALNILKAINQENDAALHVSCAYLLHRIPGLTELRVGQGDTGIVIDLVTV